MLHNDIQVRLDQLVRWEHERLVTTLFVTLLEVHNILELFQFSATTGLSHSDLKCVVRARARIVIQRR